LAATVVEFITIKSSLRKAMSANFKLTVIISSTLFSEFAMIEMYENISEKRVDYITKYATVKRRMASQTRFATNLRCFIEAGTNLSSIAALSD